MSFLIPALVGIPLALLVVDLVRLRPAARSDVSAPRRAPRVRAEGFEPYTGTIRMRAQVPERVGGREEHVHRLHEAVRRSEAASAGQVVPAADSA